MSDSNKTLGELVREYMAQLVGTPYETQARKHLDVWLAATDPQHPKYRPYWRQSDKTKRYARLTRAFYSLEALAKRACNVG